MVFYLERLDWAEAELGAGEHGDELFAVDELDGGTPSRVASLRASLVKPPVVRMRLLSARPCMAPRKSRTWLGVTGQSFVPTETAMDRQEKLARGEAV